MLFQLKCQVNLIQITNTMFFIESQFLANIFELLYLPEFFEKSSDHSDFFDFFFNT